ncbi:hypothetical protein QBC37DRAFT_381693, partial [Rhypophila decipiens]
KLCHRERNGKTEDDPSVRETEISPFGTKAPGLGLKIDESMAPNGKLVASASDDETVKLWDAGTGEVVETVI